MLKGSFRHAAELFRQGSQVILFCSDTMAEETRRGRRVKQEQDHWFRPVVSQPLVQVIDLSKSDAVDFQEHHSFSLFVRAFVAPMTRDPTALSSKLARDRLTAALLFNLGLAYHLIGIKTTNNSHMNLRHSLKYYQMAMEILGRSVHIDESKLMFLALSNNMGSIYSYFFERNKVRCCIQWMTAALKALPDTDGELGKDYVHFQMNVIAVSGTQRTTMSRAA